MAVKLLSSSTAYYFSQLFCLSVAFQSQSLISNIPCGMKHVEKLMISSVKEYPNEDIMPSTPTQNSDSFKNFEYKDHWYPVLWEEDLIDYQPTKVTIFDTDYVIAKIKKTNLREDKNTDDRNYEIIAMEDRCPHKSAALSEGRITSSGNFQCAYHGWAFDGYSGSCVEIPQSTSTNLPTSRACGKAIPATVHQRMIYLFPFGNIEKALLAPPPPTVAEIDEKGFRMITTIRDFPVDYSLLLENIMDPDHGLFAHNVKGKGFDMYTASKDCPQIVKEGWLHDGRVWKIESKVLAKDVLLESPRSPVSVEKAKRGKKNKLTVSSQSETNKIPYATTTFIAPHHVVIGRRDQTTNETKFLTCFWVCPVGTGRSRFMSAVVGKIPINIPRWIAQIFINNFLDQDTYLIATQQGNILKLEAEKMQNVANENGLFNEHGDKGIGNISNQVKILESSDVRKEHYVYRSPSEKMNMRIGSFWDATLPRAPRRIETLLNRHRMGLWEKVPSRDEVLDRKVQNFDISPDVRAVVRNCSRIKASALTISILVTMIKVLDSVNLGTSASVSSIKFLNSILRPWKAGSLLIVSWISAWVATKVKRQFFFKYDEKWHQKDMQNIPKVWSDL